MLYVLFYNLNFYLIVYCDCLKPVNLHSYLLFLKIFHLLKQYQYCALQVNLINHTDSLYQFSNMFHKYSHKGLELIFKVFFYHLYCPIFFNKSLVISESHKEENDNVPLCFVAQSCPTLCNPMDYSLPDSSVHRTSQVRILEWVAISLLQRMIMLLFKSLSHSKSYKQGHMT